MVGYVWIIRDPAFCDDNRLPLMWDKRYFYVHLQADYRQIWISEVKDMTRLPVINMAATGQNITRLRKQAGLTVGNLQQIFGFTTPQAIYKWQRGTALPTVDNLVILAAVFNTNINNILVVNWKSACFKAGAHKAR